MILVTGSKGQLGKEIYNLSKTKKFKFLFEDKQSLNICNYNKLKTIVKTINDAGIQVRPLWYPSHKQNFLKKYQRYNLVNSESFYKKTLCIPSSYFLKTNDRAGFPHDLFQRSSHLLVYQN